MFLFIRRQILSLIILSHFRGKLQKNLMYISVIVLQSVHIEYNVHVLIINLI